MFRTDHTPYHNRKNAMGGVQGSKMGQMTEQFGADNLALIETLYAQYLSNPDSVDQDWQSYFGALDQDQGSQQPNGVAQIGPSFPTGTLFAPASSGRVGNASAPGAANTAAVAASPHVETVNQPTPDALRPDPSDSPADISARLPFVQRISMFRQLPESEQRLIAGIVHEVDYKSGDTLFRIGEEARAMYIVKEGTVHVIRAGTLVATLGPGDVVGEMALLYQTRRSADVQAHTDATLLEVPATALDALLNRHGQVAREMFRMMAERLRDANARQERVDQLIRAYRVRGHTIAKLDPLDRPVSFHPELELDYHGLSEAELDVLFSSRTMHGAQDLPLRTIINRLSNTYCRSIGVQFMHIDDIEVKTWLQDRMEQTENRCKLTHDEQVRIFTKLTDAEVFERFVHKEFLGAKRFSLEGGESLIPLLDMAIEEAACHGAREVVIGMPHRGRLNVLANIMGKHPGHIFREFKDGAENRDVPGGDVKYHLGYSSDHETSQGTQVHLSLCFNPSHLEFVGPVVLGRVRAKQERIADSKRQKVVPIIIHGDAAFPGQGVVQEMLNMSQLPGYSTGGCLHIIVNNQIGFTTPPESSRSSLYATDVAKMLDIPIFHVNGEDPEGVAQVIKLAAEFRFTFQRDVIIDMYCYRRHGHNEGDEPTFTQPTMYAWIKKRQSVPEGYLQNLVKLGGFSHDEGVAIAERSKQRLADAFAAHQEQRLAPEMPSGQGLWGPYTGGQDCDTPEANTGVTADALAALMAKLTTIPETFTIHPKVKRFQKQRLEATQGDRPLDWGAGEALAFASLVSEGYTVRLSGQDSGRGTFSHRHAVLHDYKTGGIYTPLQHLHPEQGRFEVYDSPLSETAVLGFDYGCSLDTPDGLVIWEAQFGDFANGAQVIIDQFITSGENKWQRLSGLVMLLPHGFEGQGPEHSSARLERFLTMAAEDNIQVVYPTTPAQIFHCLRRQIHRKLRKPLVVMSPKSLLRHPSAASNLEAFTRGEFQRVIPDRTAPDASVVKRVLLCAGKVYYDLTKAVEASGRSDVAVIRLEQFYPFPSDALAKALEPYAADMPVIWVQEEPVNMGAWPFLRLTFSDYLLGTHRLHCVSRLESASPASGSGARHRYELECLLDDALNKVFSEDEGRQDRNG